MPTISKIAKSLNLQKTKKPPSQPNTAHTRSIWGRGLYIYNARGATPLRLVDILQKPSFSFNLLEFFTEPQRKNSVFWKVETKNPCVKHKGRLRQSHSTKTGPVARSSAPR